MHATFSDQTPLQSRFFSKNNSHYTARKLGNLRTDDPRSTSLIIRSHLRFNPDAENRDLVGVVAMLHSAEANTLMLNQLPNFQDLFHIPHDRASLPWARIITLSLALWVGGSLVLDFVVMPSLMEAGMMNSPNFAVAGFATFERFNHLELLAAASILTGILAISKRNHGFGHVTRRATILACVLLGITAIYTYVLTPHMSALGLDLNLWEPQTGLPTGMNAMHLSYWCLEAIKLAVAGWLLHLCDQRFVRSDSVAS